MSVEAWVVPLLPDPLPEIGSKVFLYGVEQGELPSFSTLDGRITRLGPSEKGQIRAYSNLPFRSTYCGAPVLDESMKVIGLVSGKSENGETAVALARYIIKLMNGIGLK